jgi:hypothetical protein
MQAEFNELFRIIGIIATGWFFGMTVYWLMDSFRILKEIKSRNR